MVDVSHVRHRHHAGGAQAVDIVPAAHTLARVPAHAANGIGRMHSAARASQRQAVVYVSLHPAAAGVRVATSVRAAPSMVQQAAHARAAPGNSVHHRHAVAAHPTQPVLPVRKVPVVAGVQIRIVVGPEIGWAPLRPVRRALRIVGHGASHSAVQRQHHRQQHRPHRRQHARGRRHARRVRRRQDAVGVPVRTHVCRVVRVVRRQVVHVLRGSLVRRTRVVTVPPRRVVVPVRRRPVVAGVVRRVDAQPVPGLDPVERHVQHGPGVITNARQQPAEGRQESRQTRHRTLRKRKRKQKMKMNPLVRMSPMTLPQPLRFLVSTIRIVPRVLVRPVVVGAVRPVHVCPVGGWARRMVPARHGSGHPALVQ